MVVHNTISQLRQNAHLSQEEFAELFHVSRQSVQKWENGLAKPELEKLVDIANYFGVSLDSLILGRDKRAMETLEYNAPIQPQYFDNWRKWELYASDLLTEYKQSVEEGLDISTYKELFSTVSTLPNDEIKKKLGDTLFEIIQHAKILPGYPYLEPSALEEIRALRTDEVIGFGEAPETALLRDKLHGAWLGRICGCMLGKTVEGIRTNELTPFLKETGNYPMHRYIYRTDLTEERCKKYPFFSVKRICADEIDAMPVDDDTNYVVLGQLVLENYGRDFTAYDVSRAWLNYQKKDAYCTAERVAYRNFINGYVPPHRSAAITTAISIRAIPRLRRRWPGGTPPFPMSRTASTAKCSFRPCWPRLPSPQTGRRSSARALRRSPALRVCMRRSRPFWSSLNPAYRSRPFLRASIGNTTSTRRMTGAIPFRTP